MYRKIAVISLLCILGLVNWAIAEKEKHLTEGRVVYLDLVPVDPRSLMQGDYMALRFRMANDVRNALPKSEKIRRWERKADAADGYVLATLDKQNIASFKSLYDNQAVAANELLMRYRVRNGEVKFATNAFFFEEGSGQYYQPARYGQFRVNKEGELLLVAMYDKDLNKLGADK